MQRSLTPRCIAKLRPIPHVSALQKRRTLSTPSTSMTRFKLPRASAETRSFHNTLVKNKVKLSAPDISVTRHHLSAPFSTDTTWPDGLQSYFRVSRQARESPNNRYWGPYTKLFSYCFGPNSYEFFVTPGAPNEGPCGEDSFKAVNCYAFIVVYDQLRRPVMFADIKDDSWTKYAGLRHKAEKHMRWWFRLMGHDCPLPRFWGLSLLGTSLRVYCGDVATGDGDMNPKYSLLDPARTMPLDFLKDGWSLDILSQEGFDRMKEIVGDIAALSKASREQKRKLCALCWH